MAKSKEYMALYRRMAFAFDEPGMAWVSPLENHLINGRTVGEVLDEAEKNGAITYEESRHTKNLEHDLYAHAALYLDGKSFTVLAERTSNEDGKKSGANVDLIMSDGQYWEVKSPRSQIVGEAKDLRFVGERISDSEHKFRDDHRTHQEETRIIFNGAHCSASDDQIAQRIKTEIDDRPNVREVLFVRKDGRVESIT